MARNDAPPFDLGQTWYGGGSIDTTSLGGLNLEGKEWLFEDMDRSVTGGRAMRSNKYVRARIVRNVSGTTLSAKRLASFQTSAGSYYGARVDAYAAQTAARGYPIDEWLPSSGVPNNDLCWVIVEGPAMCLTDVNSLGAVINVGDRVVAGTFATSTNTTGGGEVTVCDLTGATSLLANQATNFIGRALSAATTGQTSANILIEVGHW